MPSIGLRTGHKYETTLSTNIRHCKRTYVYYGRVGYSIRNYNSTNSYHLMLQIEKLRLHFCDKYFWDVGLHKFSAITVVDYCVFAFED
jgi:hypothetical protein